MIRALYTSLSGMISKEAKMNSISNNLANANTIGYKSDDLVLKSFDQVLLQNRGSKNGDAHVKNELGSLALGVELDETYTDYQQGTLENTDSEKDLAILGEGFFTVERNGNKFYTRDGSFNVDAQGYMVNGKGDYLLGNNGNRIFVANGKIDVKDNGLLTVDNGNTKVSYNLDVVDFADKNTLVRNGDNLYSGGNPTAATKYNVKQQALEKSNVNVVNGMVEMMSLYREFETNQKVVQTLDETLGKSVNQLGSVR